jgi:hypothetical protein
LCTVKPNSSLSFSAHSVQRPRKKRQSVEFRAQTFLVMCQKQFESINRRAFASQSQIISTICSIAGVSARRELFRVCSRQCSADLNKMRSPLDSHPCTRNNNNKDACQVYFSGLCIELNYCNCTPPINILCFDCSLW